MVNWKNFSSLILLAASINHAHLIASSLSPKGGETIFVNQPLTISWTTEENHPDKAGVDLAYSKDGGKTWEKFKTGISDTEKDNSFRWTIGPAEPTTQGKIRVCQAGPCTDKMDTTKAGGIPGPWYLVSGVFTVQASTAIASPAESGVRLSLDFRPDTRNVEVSFALAARQAVLLQAFDMQGRLVATLLQGDYAAGEHALSVFSNRTASANESLVFRLKVGDQVKTHTWMVLR
jgi:hypothetical protein